MVLSHKLQIELDSSRISDFQEFLLGHRKVDSFQKINDRFSVNLIHQNQEEYAAFLEGIKEIYQIKNLKEIKFCQAGCRDGTDCLNRARYGEFCWKHKER